MITNALREYDLRVAPKNMTQRSAKRPRRTREEGKKLLINAASELLSTHSADELGIREIGAAAGVHYRFISEWFGGKVGLFRAVHEARTNQISELIATTSRLGQRQGSTVASISEEMRLVNWLIQNGSEFKNLTEAFPAISATKEWLSNVHGLSTDDANVAAQIMGSIIFADSLLRPHVKMNGELADIVRFYIQTISMSQNT